MLDGEDWKDRKKRPELPPNLHFRPWMLGPKSIGPLQVEMGALWNQKRIREGWVYRSLPDIMAELGHSSLDLVKLDIEGTEFSVLEHVLAARPRQVALEAHSHIFVETGGKTDLQYATVAQFVELLRSFRRHGYAELRMECKRKGFLARLLYKRIPNSSQIFANVDIQCVKF